MRRSVVAPANEQVDIVRGSFSNGFDVAVVEVANPPGDLHTQGLVAGTGAERDALYEAVNAKMNATEAAAALGALKEPEFPGKDATEAQLAQFQKDLGKYNRMFEMMSKIMANAHEMKKALIGNLPR